MRMRYDEGLSDEEIQSYENKHDITPNTIKIMTKNRKEQNVVKTTTKMNLVAAVLNDTLRDAEVHFRALQHANGRGTTVSQYTDLERLWIDKVGGMNYMNG